MQRNIMLVLMLGSLVAVGLATPVSAGETEPVIVIPGRPGVPVMLYGRDVSGAVLEGDWGLARPGVVTPTIVQEGWVYPLYGPAPAYFPATGRRPRYGRLEVIPPANRRLPRPAEPYYRDWMSQSGHAPATIPPPYEPPPVIVAPRIGGRQVRGTVNPVRRHTP